MKTTLDEKSLKPIFKKIAAGNTIRNTSHPGEPIDRQPVHTVYGGAHLFKFNTGVKISEVALKTFMEYATDWGDFKQALGMQCDDEIAKTVYKRVKEKLESQALEDFRIDFEDGFGNRPDAEEDETAVSAALQVAQGMKEQTLPPFIGIRIKTFTEELKARGIRTLDIFLTSLLEASKGKLPKNFVVTLPKITSNEHVSALVDCFELLESKLNLEAGILKMEFMIETPESILNEQGNSAIQGFVKASKGRCTGAHFGTYDYTASVQITAKYQAMDHAACDFARSFMKVSLAETGIFISDGATNVMPVGPHRGKDLSTGQKEENLNVVHAAWKLNFNHVRHSLYNAFYQGWDLHPAQLPVRYAALYSFFLEGLQEATNRLKVFVESAAKATLTGDVFDDAATGQGLLNYFLRALNCGAITMEEITKTGLTLEEIRGKSFKKILENRKMR
jgi:citrate lyase beta subunit